MPNTFRRAGSLFSEEDVRRLNELSQTLIRDSSVPATTVAAQSSTLSGRSAQSILNDMSEAVRQIDDQRRQEIRDDTMQYSRWYALPNIAGTNTRLHRGNYSSGGVEDRGDGRLLFKTEDGAVMGALNINGRRMDFHGDIEECGRLLFDHLKFYFSIEYDRVQARSHRIGYDEGYADGCRDTAQQKKTNPFAKRSWWDR